MILTGTEIDRRISDREITFTPYNPLHVNPNSIDITLSDRLLRYTQPVIDPRLEPEVEEITIPETGFVLQPHSFWLGSSNERVGSTKFVPLVHAKSSTARAGLFVHVTADLIDIGSIGVITFQLYSTIAFKLYPGMRIGQMTFWRPFGEIKLYDGKYQNSGGPRKSMIHADEFWKKFA